MELPQAMQLAVSRGVAVRAVHAGMRLRARRGWRLDRQKIPFLATLVVFVILYATAGFAYDAFFSPGVAMRRSESGAWQLLHADRSLREERLLAVAASGVEGKAQVYLGSNRTLPIPLGMVMSGCR